MTTGASSIMNISNGELVIKSQSYFDHSGFINVNNAGFAGKTVYFGSGSSSLDFASVMNIRAGSKIYITKSELILHGYALFTVAGHIELIDGNAITYSSGGMTLTSTGIFATRDTDGTNDGVFTMSGGGGTLTNNGQVYLESLSASGGSYTVNDNNIVFIKNMRSGSFDDGNNTINVSATGTLYYCQNPVRQEAGRGVLGTVATGGKLYYSTAADSYPSTLPNTNLGSGQPEMDYSVSNADQIDMATVGYTSCPDAYSDRLSAALPIELMYFHGKDMKEFIFLNWATASETNNDFFNILRSYDGISFENIAKIDGSGTTTSVHYYAYKDYDAKTGMNYYKLKQTDFDGKNVDSKIISIGRNDFDYNIMIYPIPARSTNIKLGVNKDIGTINVKCIDASGHVLFTAVVDTKELSEYNLGQFNMPSGTYFIKVETDNAVYIKEIIVNN
jgi:hypothetical protein